MIVALQALIYFRESLLDTLGRWFIPVFKNFAQLTYNKEDCDSEDDESEDHVYADYDDEKGVVFYPPVYAQRYAAVTDCLMDGRWCGQLEKIVDLGYNDMSYIKYLKDVYGVRKILGVDLECVSLRCISDLFSAEEQLYARNSPIEITLFQGNAADPDYRLIGCDAVVAIELIEHMLPQDLDRLVHTIFGFIKPRVAVITTPNGDFNVLFKSLENNGLRRMDHFFEWTREQFHDWCSNIVERYPDFTVTSKGIGPGPPDTLSLGCCSQMAIFVNNKYHKQHELTMNSLSMVSEVPDQNITELIGVWENSSNNSRIDSNSDSFYDLIEPRESTSITNLYSETETVYTDSGLQCNIESELARNYLMFEFEQMYINVLVPRRKVADKKVYMFENISSRLNCSTLQVKKFSKETQNLMAKNKLDTLVHTREVVNKLRIVTEVLNINNEPAIKEDTHTWNNINWGDNAPYWNQFYKVVKQYTYPFERKSDDTRILECVSDEINRLVDLHDFDDRSEDSPHSIRLEIPLNQLMNSVQNITDDVTKVQDILEWNGYEVVDGFVVYSGPPLELAIEGTKENKWLEDVPASDWEVAETVSLSDRTVSQELAVASERSLRLAIDTKVRRIRRLLFTDQDITREFENVLCRLMKMSLKAFKHRQDPPPIKWILYKLYDLLTLTEKSVTNRKNKFIENYPLKSLEYYSLEESYSYPVRLNLLQFKDDTGVKRIIEDYQDLVTPCNNIQNDLLMINFELEDDQSSFNLFGSREETDNEQDFGMEKPSIENAPEELTQPDSFETWLDINNSASEDVANSDCSNKTQSLKKQRKTSKGINVLHSLMQSSKSIYPHAAKRRRMNEKKLKKTGCRLKIQKNLVKAISLGSGSFKTMIQRKTVVTKTSKKLLRKNSQKESGKKLREAISYEIVDDNNKKSDEVDNYNEVRKLDEFISTDYDDTKYGTTEICSKEEDNNELGKSDEFISTNYDKTKYGTTDMSSKEVIRHIEIVTESGNETIALSCTTTTDITDVMSTEEKEVKNLVPYVQSFSQQQEEHRLDNDQPEAIFIFDVNEPSTSKGVRHSIADAQCGSDMDLLTFSKISAAKSDVKLVKPCPSPTSTTIKDSIGFSSHNKTDYGTTMSSEENCLHKDSFLFPSKRSVGIKIKDSDTMLFDTTNIMINDQNIPDISIEKVLEQIQNNYTSHAQIPTNTNTQYSSLKPEVDAKDNTIISKPPHLRSKTINDFRLPKPLETKNTGHFYKYNTSTSAKSKLPVLATKNLKCGGIQVHSYKQRSSSEDVLYHGEWQKSGGRFLSKKCLIRKISISPERSSSIICNNATTSNKPADKFQTAVTKTLHISPNPSDMKTAKQPRSFKKEGKQNYEIVGKISSKLTPSTQIKKIPKFICANKKLSRVGDNKYNNLENNKFKSMETKSTVEPKITRRHCYKSDSKLTKHKKLISDIPNSLLEFQANVAPSVAQVYKIKCTDLENVGSNSKTVEDMDTDESFESFGTYSPNSSKDSPSYCKITNYDSINTIRTSSTNKTSNSRGIKNIKKNKNCTFTDELNIQNKENIPHVVNKNVFGGRHKVYTARCSKDIKPISKQQCKVPGNLNFKSSSPTMSKRQSVESVKTKKPNNNGSVSDHQHNEPIRDAEGNLVIVVDPYTKLSATSYESNDTDSLTDTKLGNQTDNGSVKEEIVDAITQDLKSLVEERSLNITSPLAPSDTEESRYYTDDSSIHGSNSSNTTFKTVLQESNMTNNMLTSSVFETTDGSVISVDETIVLANNDNTLFESFSGETTRKDESIETFQEPREGPSSVRDIFDRKDFPKLQVFSGFSINAEPESGDQPSYVCSVIINSDTGSLSLDRSRMATSDDLSGSNFSMLLNEDEVVPEWLFDMIQNHQSNDGIGDEDDDSDGIGVALIIPIDMPGEPARFDINGNAEPGVGAGAGAGDGHGMHSDNSHDSSGQGTSLSSTDTSSTGERSETVLIDPSGFASHYEMLREAIDNNIPSLAIATNNLPATSRDNDEAIIGGNATSSPIVERPRGWNSLIHGDVAADGLRTSSHDLTLRLQRLSVTSDIDADVSSLDTDAVDSDN